MLRFVALGRIDLAGLDEERADSVLGAPKRLGLLAYLVLARPGGYRRRDSLLPLLWPERDASRARHALRNTLYELRQALGKDTLPGRGQDEVTVAHDRLWSDAVAFREALEAGDDRRALDLYGGELLPGLHINDTVPSFEKWLESERSRLQREVLEAARRLTDEATREGDVDEAVRWARRAASLDPYDEVRLRQLMRLLARAGRRARAVRAYEEFVERVSSDLGFRPESETRALAASIRSSASGASGDLGVQTSTGALPGDEQRPSGPVEEDTGERDEPASESSLSDVPASHGGQDGAENDLSERHPSTGVGTGYPTAAWLSAIVLAALASGVVWSIVASNDNRGTPGSKAPSSTRPGVAERVAIFPFRVHREEGSEESAFLSAGLANLLATDLDGSGNLHAVSPRALRIGVAGTEGKTVGPDSAADVSRELEAGLFLLGNAVVISERVKLTAALYRTGSDHPLARTSAEGGREQVFDLVDQLAAELLASRSSEQELSLVRLAVRTTESLPALKAFLVGDDHFHAGRFGSAATAYRRAVEADSGFALAHHRLSVSAEWMGDRTTARRAGERAVRGASRLPLRERMLVSAHLTSLRGNAAEAERQYREIIATYPDDLEAWYQLGEILFHYAPAVGRSIGEARKAFTEVVALSPDHVPALIHLARIAAAEGRADDVSRLTGRVMALVPGSPWDWEARALNVAAGKEAREEELVEELSEANDRSVRRAAWSASVFAQDLATGSRLARLLSASWRSPETRRVARAWTTELAVARGRWQQLGRSLVRRGNRNSPFQAYRDALLAALPFVELPDSALTILRERLHTEREKPSPVRPERAEPDSSGLAELLPRLRIFATGLLCSRAGDFRRALARASELDSAVQAAGAVPLADKLGRIVRAHVAWQRGRAERALRILGEEAVRTRSSLMFGRDYVQPYERYLRARILEAVGRSSEALRWYSSFQHQHVHHLVYLAPAHFHRARILEASGQARRAIRHYRSLLEIWEVPDPEFSSLYHAAERRLRRLTADP